MHSLDMADGGWIWSGQGGRPKGGREMTVGGLDTRGLVELIAALTIAIGLIGALVQAARQGIGPRSIKFSGALLMVPTILILALEKSLEPATLGTIIGAVAGYLLSGVSEIVMPRDDYQHGRETAPIAPAPPPAPST
jgi:hypothetical protein